MTGIGHIPTSERGSLSNLGPWTITSRRYETVQAPRKGKALPLRAIALPLLVSPSATSEVAFGSMQRRFLSNRVTERWWQRDCFKFAKLGLLVGNAVCYKKVEFSTF